MLVTKLPDRRAHDIPAADPDVYRSVIDSTLAPYFVRTVPAQLSPNDRRVYYGHALHFYEGRGVIIDAGTLAGGTSTAMACGLLARPGQPHRKQAIYAYDLFQCDWHTPIFFRENFGVDYQSGTSFRSIYDDVTHPFRSLIEVREGDLLNAEWHGDDIELLSLDVCKTAALNIKASEMFLPYLLPGGYLFQQDYRTVWLPWIHLVMERLSPYFTRLYETERGATVVFQANATPPLSKIREALADDGLEQQIATMNRAADNSWTAETRAFIQLAMAPLMVHCGQPRQAVQYLDSLTLPVMSAKDYDAFFLGQKAEVRGYAEHHLPR